MRGKTQRREGRERVRERDRASEREREKDQAASKDMSMLTRSVPRHVSETTAR